MSEPTLNEAIVALRATRGDATEALQTLERIQVSLDTRSPRALVGRVVRLPGRRTLQAAAVTLLGLTLATTSYAAFFGLPPALRAWFAASAVSDRASGGSERASHAARNVSRAAIQDVPPSSASATPTAAALPVLEPAPRDPTASPVEPSRVEPTPLEARSPSARAGHAAAQRAARAARQAALAEREQLYREAHRLHFVARDYSAALAAWERYLRVADDATLAVEARYNRALCLVRTGSYAEARQALEPIARGEAGAYRQREARALLLRIP